jgi:hypothetical protein
MTTTIKNRPCQYTQEANTKLLSQRQGRRVDAIVAALREHIGGELGKLDLLATDSSDPTHIAALERLAPYAWFIVSSQLAAPLADQPLGDLIEALVKDSDFVGEQLAQEAVKHSDIRSKSLWERCQTLLGDPKPNASPCMILAARRLLHVGHDAVALRSLPAPHLVKVADDLGREVLELLTSGADSKLERTLLDAIDEASQHPGVPAGDLGHLGTVMAPFASTTDLTTMVAETVVVRSERRDYGEKPVPLSGISVDPPASETTHEPRISSSWAAVFERLDPAHLVQSKVEQRTLADVALWTARVPVQSLAPRSTPEPFDWIEYEVSESLASEPDFNAAVNLSAFLDRELAAKQHVRHVGLVVRGWTTKERPFSLMLGSGQFLPIATLGSCLRKALLNHGRGPVTLLVLDDWRLMSLEVAYELRDVAMVLVTGIERPLEDESPTPLGSSDPQDYPSPQRVRICEEDAVERVVERVVLNQSTRDLPQFGEIARDWRRWVAIVVAMYLDMHDPRHGTMQAINLQYLEGLCRRFDRVCQIMLDNLDKELVWGALERGFTRDHLITLLNGAHVEGNDSNKELANLLNGAMEDVNRWSDHPGATDEERRSAPPFWIGRTPGHGGGDGLRINTNEYASKDYLDLSFHEDVRLRALISAWQLLAKHGGQPYWGLISLGLSNGPHTAVRKQLEALYPKVAQVLHESFIAGGPPPLMTLSIEPSPDLDGYELRLSSSESTALLNRQRSRVNLEAVDSLLESLGFLLARASASPDVWSYIESLGACLAEDVISGDLPERLADQRRNLLEIGRGRSAHLALALPLELMRYPWEIMQLRSGQLLSECFAVGRQMWSASGRGSKKQGDGKLRVLIVGDPAMGNGAQLLGAQVEANFIARVCEDVQHELGTEMDFVRERDVFIGKTMTRASLRRLLRESRYDVLHFAGHGSFLAGKPNASGWGLSDGTLTATELRNTLASSESPPWLIFANACDVGMTADGKSNAYQGDVHGIADVCIREGVSAFIAPLWKINDKSAQLLASEFYRALLINRTTVGVALQRARQRTRQIWEEASGQRGIEDISWAGVILFGNPTQRIGGDTTM